MHLIKILALSSTLLVVSLKASAQSSSPAINPLDTLGYQISVISRVKDVAAISGLSFQKQLQLANFFKREEATLDSALRSDIPLIQMQNLQRKLIDEFQALLTPQELAAFRVRRKDSIYASPAITAH